MQQTKGRRANGKPAGTIALLAVVVGGVSSSRAQRPAPTLAEIQYAAWHTAYRGVEVSQGRRAQAEVIQHQDGARMVRSVGGAGPLEVDDGTYSWRYMPRRQSVAIRPSASARSSRPAVTGVPLTVVGADTVAGRPVSIYTATRPRIGETIQVYVDDATLVPLRLIRTGPKGRSVQWDFASIEYGPQPTVRFAWPRDASLSVKRWSETGPQGPVEEVQAPVAVPRILPRGLLFDGIWERDLAGRQALWLHFHGGHWDASLFETVAAPSAPQESGVDTWNLGPLNLTLVTNLPPALARRFRDSVRLVHGG